MKTFHTKENPEKETEQNRQAVTQIGVVAEEVVRLHRSQCSKKFLRDTSEFAPLT